MLLPSTFAEKLTAMKPRASIPEPAEKIPETSCRHKKAMNQLLGRPFSAIPYITVQRLLMKGLRVLFWVPRTDYLDP